MVGTSILGVFGTYAHVRARTFAYVRACFRNTTRVTCRNRARGTASHGHHFWCLKTCCSRLRARGSTLTKSILRQNPTQNLKSRPKLTMNSTIVNFDDFFWREKSRISDFFLNFLTFFTPKSDFFSPLNQIFFHP